MSLEGVRRDWVRLAEQDPLWAVYVAADKRGGRWDPVRFLETGRADVAAAVSWLTGLGAGPRWGRVLDFGCGPGRLTQALASHAGAVVGVDVAAPMLDLARRLDPPPNCEFVLNETGDLAAFGTGEFDLVYSELVLQHLPARVIEDYLREFVRVLAPGGVAMVGCTVRPLWTFKGAIWRLVPGPLVRLAQRLVLGYPAPMRMTRFPPSRMHRVVDAAGGRVLAAAIADDRAAHWRTARYVISGSSRTRPSPRP